MVLGPHATGVYIPIGVTDFEFYLLYFIYVFVCVFVWVYMSCVSADACRGQKGA